MSDERPTQMVTVQLQVKAPADATHYSGDLLDDPTWYKFAINSTGTVKAWYYANRWHSPWMYHQEGEAAKPPHWVKKIEDINIQEI